MGRGHFSPLQHFEVGCWISIRSYQDEETILAPLLNTDFALCKYVPGYGLLGSADTI